MRFDEVDRFTYFFEQSAGAVEKVELAFLSIWFAVIETTFLK